MERITRVSLAVLLPLLLLVANSVAFAQSQELPPGPKVIYRSVLPNVTMQEEFEIINLILEFAPGAATPLHTHGGPGIVTVLDGEVTFAVEGKPDQVAKPGEFYLDLPGTPHTAANKGISAARVSYVALLPKGATLTTVVSGPQTGELPPGPKTIFRNTLPGVTMQGEFEIINLILEFAPGAATPLHTHGGPGIVTVLDGEITFGVEGKPDQVAKPGEVYLDLPGQVHTAANKTSSPARVSYAVVLQKGAALTTPVGGAQTQPTAAAPQPSTEHGTQVGMPRTGGSYSEGMERLLSFSLALALALALLGLGVKLTHRHGRHEGPMNR
jgi:quercetin dioxygenase-like cupin family protein